MLVGVGWVGAWTSCAIPTDSQGRRRALERTLVAFAEGTSTLVPECAQFSHGGGLGSRRGPCCLLSTISTGTHVRVPAIMLSKGVFIAIDCQGGGFRTTQLAHTSLIAPGQLRYRIVEDGTRLLLLCTC